MPAEARLVLRLAQSPGRVSSPGVETKSHRKGAEANTKADRYTIFFRPNMSDSDPAGSETMIPGMVEAAITRPPTSPTSAPRLFDSIGRTGFLDKVELSMASAPAKLSPLNDLFLSSILATHDFVTFIEKYVVKADDVRVFLNGRE
jgi:hypothetical protein